MRHRFNAIVVSAAVATFKIDFFVRKSARPTSVQIYRMADFIIIRIRFIALRLQLEERIKSWF